jgi:methylglutaconyl-CoA hydratase
MSVNHLRYEVADRVAFLTLARPEKRNAFSRELVAALKAAFSRAEADEAVKVIVLQAEGQVFCAGADLDYLRGLQSASYADNLEDSAYLKDLYQQIYRHPKPVIAAVQGHALAGGCGLVTVCDYVVAVPEAQFGYTEVRIGFVPAIVMVFLLRKLGEAQAKRLLLTGDLIGAAEAQTLGLVHEVVPPENLEARVRALAQHLCTQNSAQAMAATKQLIANVQELPLAEALDLAAATNAQARAFADCQRGIAAFLAKEKLVW